MPPRPLTAADHAAVVDLVCTASGGPGGRDLHTHGTPREALRRELDGLVEPVGAIVEDRGAVVLEVAPEQQRGWVWGPAVPEADVELADALFELALSQLPPGIARVSAYVARGSWLERWWRRRDVRATEIVHLYGLQDAAPSAPDPRVRRVVPGDLAAVGPLHERAFPGTYLSAAEVVGPHDRRHTWVADLGEGAVGYACAEVRHDDTGYVHYVAVHPDARRQGLARALLGAVLTVMGPREVSLTVRDGNPARALYDQAGFTLQVSGQPFDLPLD